MILARSLLQQLNGNKKLSIYLLSDSCHEGVINLPQIKVTCKDIDLDLSSYDTLIFSSKNGVKSISKSNQNWKDIPSYAIGSPTADAIREFGGKVEYIAKSSYGNDFAKELIPRLKGKKVLFIRAKKVLSDLENLLKNAGVDLSSIIAYETVCTDKIDEKINENSIFIFTSPSTVKCFFKNHNWHKSYKAVCIGTVTAKALPKEISLHVSSTQTIAACIDLAKTLIKQN